MFLQKNSTYILALVSYLILFTVACSRDNSQDTVTNGQDEITVTAPTEVPNEIEPIAGPTDLYVDGLDVLILESFPVQVTVSVTGNLADGCVVLEEITAEQEGNIFTLQASTNRVGDICTMALVPFSENVSLDVNGLSAGTYQVILGEQSAQFTLDMDNE